MAVPDTDDTNSSKSFPSSSPQAARPSWETAPRPAPAPQPAPRPAPPSSGPAASPYYAAPAAAPSSPAYAPAAPAPAAYVSDADVQYDLAGNPIPSSAPASSPAAAPFGYAAGNAASGVWPPPVGGGPQHGGPQYGAQAYRNNSGEQSHLPPELEKLHWHWGAFFFPTFWSRRHGLRALAFIIVIGFALLRGLRMAVPTASVAVFFGVYLLYFVAHLGVQIYFGLNGHRIGWRNRHFPGGVEEYFKVQNAWMWWGFAITTAGIILAIFTFGSMYLAGTALTPLPYQHHSYGSSGYGSGASSSGNSSTGQ